MYFGISYIDTSYINKLAENMYKSVLNQQRSVQASIFSSFSSYNGGYNHYSPASVSAYSYSQTWDDILASLTKVTKSVQKTVSGAAKTAYGTVSNFGNSMVSKARSFLGYNEANGSYKLFTNGRTEAWCADFVSYIARQCGMKNFNFRSVQQIVDWGRNNNRFSSTPKVGDAIIFKGWDAKRGTYASHTGIVTKVANGRVYTIEGNTSDKVAERSYALNDSKITGYVTIA